MTDPPANRLQFVHITDLHIVEPGKPRQEAEPSGNVHWQALVRGGLGTNTPKWLFVTGDIADHGEDAEWDEFARDVGKLKEAHPQLRVLAAPGNHDLATAYNTIEAHFSLFMYLHRRLPRARSNGIYLRRYLDHAARLEPELRAHDGVAVRDIVDEDERAIAMLRETILRPRWRARDRDAAWQQSASAREQFPEITAAQWEQVRAGGEARRGFEDTTWPDIWCERWYRHFPLHLVDAESRQAVVILNSVAPEPGLLGSAWGQFSADQLDRLDELLTSFKDRGYATIYVLCHHAPLAWEGYTLAPTVSRPATVLGWLVSSVLPEETERLFTILGKFPAGGSRRRGHARRTLVFLCGHRHGGRQHRTLAGVWQGVRILEAASFAADETPAAAGWFGRNNAMEIGLLSLC